eukprot:1427380-Pyramimonas_sp.AAC.2
MPPFQGDPDTSHIKIVPRVKASSKKRPREISPQEKKRPKPKPPKPKEKKLPAAHRAQAEATCSKQTKGTKGSGATSSTPRPSRSDLLQHQETRQE